MIVLLLTLMQFTHAGPHAGSAVQSTSEVDTLLTTVDSLRSTGQYEQAFRDLRNLDSRTAANPDVLWRLAHLRIEVAESSPDDSRQALEKAFRQALNDAELAVQRGPHNSNAYAARAMAAGKLSKVTSSTQEKIRLSRVMKESVDQAVTYDPRNDVAYYIRGRWHIELASLSFMERTIARALYGGVPSASLDRALADLRRAVELQDRIVYRLELARLYAQMDQEQRAEEQITRILQMPVKHPDDPRYIREARELLDEIRPTSGSGSGNMNERFGVSL